MVAAVVAKCYPMVITNSKTHLFRRLLDFPSKLCKHWSIGTRMFTKQSNQSSEPRNCGLSLTWARTVYQMKMNSWLTLSRSKFTWWTKIRNNLAIRRWIFQRASITPRITRILQFSWIGMSSFTGLTRTISRRLVLSFFLGRGTILTR